MGDRRVTMAELAAAANGRSTLYRYFPTREALDRAVEELEPRSLSALRGGLRAARWCRFHSGPRAARPARDAPARGDPDPRRGPAALGSGSAYGGSQAGRRCRRRSLRGRHRRLASAAAGRFRGVPRTACGTGARATCWLSLGDSCVLCGVSVWWGRAGLIVRAVTAAGRECRAFASLGTGGIPRSGSRVRGARRFGRWRVPRRLAGRFGLLVARGSRRRGRVR